jgi:hypothetical protein
MDNIDKEALRQILVNQMLIMEGLFMEKPGENRAHQRVGGEYAASVTIAQHLRKSKEG